MNLWIIWITVMSNSACIPWWLWGCQFGSHWNVKTACDRSAFNCALMFSLDWSKERLRLASAKASWGIAWNPNSSGEGQLLRIMYHHTSSMDGDPTLIHVVLPASSRPWHDYSRGQCCSAEAPKPSSKSILTPQWHDQLWSTYLKTSIWHVLKLGACQNAGSFLWVPRLYLFFDFALHSHGAYLVSLPWPWANVVL